MTGNATHAANRLAPKFLQIENLSSRGKIILWRDKIPPDEKKSTALGDVPDSGNPLQESCTEFPLEEGNGPPVEGLHALWAVVYKNKVPPGEC